MNMRQPVVQAATEARRFAGGPGWLVRGPRAYERAGATIGGVPLPLTDAQAHVLDRVPSGLIAEVATRDALGLVLAEAVTAAEAVPPFANTAMDGYAVVAADTDGATAGQPVRLPVVAEIGRAHV